MKKPTSEKSKHTPGSWKVLTSWRREHSLWSSLITKEENSDHEIMKIDQTDMIHSEMMANAQLIAASPDLLAACEFIKKCIVGRALNNEDGEIPDTEELDKAIKKARG